MSKTNAMETDMLELYFTNVAHTNIGDAGGLLPSGGPGNLYISLHTLDAVGEASDQTTSEAAYTSYARLAMSRAVATWTVTNDTVDNDNDVQFPAATGGSETETDFGVGTDASGAGNLLYYGALTADLAVSSGITPEFKAGDLNVTEG